MYVSIQHASSLMAGVLILLFPKLLNYIIALYLILSGLSGLIVGFR